jgi:hypothetical protein
MHHPIVLCGQAEVLIDPLSHSMFGCLQYIVLSFLRCIRHQLDDQEVTQ